MSNYQFPTNLTCDCIEGETCSRCTSSAPTAEPARLQPPQMATEGAEQVTHFLVDVESQPGRVILDLSTRDPHYASGTVCIVHSFDVTGLVESMAANLLRAAYPSNSRAHSVAE